MEWQVPPDEAGNRLDKWLLLKLTGRSRASIQRLIEQERVQVDGRARASSFPLRGGERVTVDLEATHEATLQPVALELTVVCEDDHLLVIDKPQGLSVHASTSGEPLTIAHALLARGHPLSNLSGDDRPGIVHRLDKHTSGLLLVAKTNEAHAALGVAFRTRAVEKQYTALCNGDFEAEEFVVDAPIGRDPRHREKMKVLVGGEKHSTTVVKVVERFAHSGARADFTLVHAEPRTGRTHQIRVHLQHLGHPVVGDSEYGGRGRARAAAEQRGDLELVAMLEALSGQLLHANQLRFAHPITGRAMELTSPLGESFQRILRRLRA